MNIQQAVKIIHADQAVRTVLKGESILHFDELVTEALRFFNDHVTALVNEDRNTEAMLLFKQANI